MKLGTRPRYSLRMMLELARLSEGDRPVAMQDIATWSAISRRYLDQLVVPLKAAGLVRAHAGRHGGYTLARSASDISLRDILAATGVFVAFAECVDEPRRCARSPRCQCRLVWEILTHRVREVLDEFSLANVADPEWLLGRLAEEAKARAAKDVGRARGRPLGRGRPAPACASGGGKPGPERALPSRHPRAHARRAGSARKVRGRKET